jgi:hypothetical protein
MPEKHFHLLIEPCPCDDIKTLREIKIIFWDPNLARAFYMMHQDNKLYTYEQDSKTVCTTSPHGLKHIKFSANRNFVFVFEHSDQAEKWLQKGKPLTYQLEEHKQPREVHIKRSWSDKEVGQELHMFDNEPEDRSKSSSSTTG